MKTAPGSKICFLNSVTELIFFTIELFFRGFIILAFIKYGGKNVILPMAVFYCTIHFGKPVAECISSYFGGLILGAIVYNTKSIWGGLIIHLGIAWSYGTDWNNEIKLQTRKPDSVSKLSFIWSQHYCCDLSAYPPIFHPSSPRLRRVRSGEQPSETGLHGISACKVYPSCVLLHKTVSSYLTFSPLSSRAKLLFSVALSLRNLRNRPLTGAMLYAVRTFLDARAPR